MVEQSAVNRWVVGSSPTSGASRTSPWRTTTAPRRQVAKKAKMCGEVCSNRVSRRQSLTMRESRLNSWRPRTDALLSIVSAACSGLSVVTCIIIFPFWTKFRLRCASDRAHCGIEAGRYISLERLIEQNKERYYEVLE